MQHISIDKRDGKVTIIHKGHHPKRSQSFFLAIQEAILDGYRFPENPGNQDISARNFRSMVMGKAVLYKEGAMPEVTSTEEVIQEDVMSQEDLTKEVEDSTKEEKPAEQKKAGRPSKKKK